MKKILKITSLCLILAICSTFLFACNKDDDKDETPVASSFVAVDVNPSVELILDQNDNVMSVRAANEDAEVMLYGEEGIVGVNVETATEKIVTLAVDCGYVDENTYNISVTVSGDTAALEDAIYNRVNGAVNKVAEKVNLRLQAEKACDFVLEKELQKVKKANEGKEGYADLTVGKYRLIKIAMATDRKLKLDDAVKMSNEELTQKVEAEKEYWNQKYGRAYELAVGEATFAYRSVIDAYKDAAYAEVYTKRSIKNFSFSALKNYGDQYVALRVAYRALDHYYTVYKAQIADPILTSDDVLNIANALSIPTEEYEAFKLAVTDSEGNITEESINAYIDKEYRNSSDEDRQKIAKAYDVIDAKFDAINEALVQLKSEDLLEISVIINRIDIGETIESIEDVEDVLELLENKINEVYEYMDKDLTDEEKAEIKESQDKTDNKVKEAETKYNEAVASAKTKAENALNEAKQLRLQHRNQAGQKSNQN